MPDVQFGKSAYSRNRGNLTELPLVNMMAEQAPSENIGVVLQSRPGLVEQGTEMGTAEIKNLFQADGVFGGDIFGVSGSNLYRGATDLGAITGSGYVSFAATELEILVNAGASIHCYDGATLTVKSFPDGANVIKIVYLAGYYIAIRENSQRWYFSLDGTTWDGLDFASAEEQPDFILDAIVYNDLLVLLGSRTVEHWAKTGDADLPFQPIDGLSYDKGTKATGCATKFDNGFCFVTDENLVVRSGNEPVRISDHGIEERITNSSSCKLFSYYFEGHEYLAVRLDNATMLYDAATRQWHEAASYAKTNWLATCAVKGPIFGGPDGKLLEYGGHIELGGDLERRFRGGFPITGSSVIIYNLRLECEVGETPNLTGDYLNPIVEMRYSRNKGRTWSNWRGAKLGKQGKYRTRVEWRALGTFDPPGALFEIRITDPVGFRVSQLLVNERYGGRSR